MSRGEYLPTHFKNMREVAAALSGRFQIIHCAERGSLLCGKRREAETKLISLATGMKLQKAFTYLADVKEHKQVIPYRRFAGGIGRATQAKQFGTTKGEYRLELNAMSGAGRSNLARRR